MKVEEHCRELVDKLYHDRDLSDLGLLTLMECESPEIAAYLNEKARTVRERYYGKDVYIRGLIEFTNFCKNDCYYCGIRRSNKNAQRYRLTEGEIISCAADGYALGFRTFVLQGGEDPYFTDDKMTEIVSAIKTNFPDCAVTLSIGERERDSYAQLRKAGADRYLLRHETADADHYAALHPQEMSYPPPQPLPPYTPGVAKWDFSPAPTW